MHFQDCLDLDRDPLRKAAHANRCACVAANVTKQLHKKVGTTVNNGGTITGRLGSSQPTIPPQGTFSSDSLNQTGLCPPSYLCTRPVGRLRGVIVRLCCAP